MRVAQGSVLTFQTTSDDYKARLTGPGINAEVRAGDALLTTPPGFYTLSVMDRRLRTLSVTLIGKAGSAIPPEQPATHDEMVSLRYEVA